MEKILQLPIKELNYKWSMTDTSHCKAHPQADAAAGVNQTMERTKEDSKPKFTLP